MINFCLTSDYFPNTISQKLSLHKNKICIYALYFNSPLKNLITLAIYFSRHSFYIFGLVVDDTSNTFYLYRIFTPSITYMQTYLFAQIYIHEYLIEFQILLSFLEVFRCFFYIFRKHTAGLQTKAGQSEGSENVSAVKFFETFWRKRCEVLQFCHSN